MLFFVSVTAWSAICFSHHSNPPAVVAVNSNMLTLSANVLAKDYFPKNKLHLPLDKWTQNCDWTISLFLPYIIEKQELCWRYQSVTVVIQSVQTIIKRCNWNWKVKTNYQKRDQKNWIQWTILFYLITIKMKEIVWGLEKKIAYW